jgi:hypothetical protein
LKPDEPEFLRSRGTLATWVGDYPRVLLDEILERVIDYWEPQSAAIANLKCVAYDSRLVTAQLVIASC